MSIPTSGFAALLVVATFALSSCGSDDGPATATTPVAGSGSGSTVVETVTQTATATTGSTPSTRTTTPSTTTEPQPKPKPKPATSKPPSTTRSATSETSARTCPPVDVGVRDGDLDSTFADMRTRRNINCVAAAEIVRQWGGQQIGGSDALLPDGWKCTRNNVCRDRNSSVSFVLDSPSPSE